MSSRRNSVHLIVTKDVPAECQEQWLRMGDELSTETWKEDGCITYMIVRSRDISTRFYFIEEWASQLHLDAHAASSHFQRLVPQMDAISAMPSIDFCTLGSNKEQFPVSAGKILVLYDSSSNCTEQMADLVAEGAFLVDRTEVRIRCVPGEPNPWDRIADSRTNKHPFASFEDILWADGIACGSPTNLGCVSWRMKKFWDDFSQTSTNGGWGAIDGKIGCSFTSTGGNAGGGELVNQAMNAILMNFGLSVFGITDYVSFKQTCHYGAVCVKAPREPLDRMPCIRQGTRLAEFVGLYLHGRKELHPLRASKAVDNREWGFPGIPLRSASMEKLVEINSRPFSAAGVLEDHTVTPRVKKVLIFTRMLDYTHGSTAAAAAWVAKTCAELGWEGIISDDEALLESVNEEEGLFFDLIVFVNNSGEIFDPEGNILSRHIAAGRGVLGIHAALACFLSGEDASGATIMEPTTPVMESIFKAHFQNHPPVQTGTVVVDPSVAQELGLSATVPAQFAHTDEFFNYTRNPAEDPEVKVLAYVDEKTYSGGLMGEKHPVVRESFLLLFFIAVLIPLSPLVSRAIRRGTTQWESARPPCSTARWATLPTFTMASARRTSPPFSSLVYATVALRRRLFKSWVNATVWRFTKMDIFDTNVGTLLGGRR